MPCYARNKKIYILEVQIGVTVTATGFILTKQIKMQIISFGTNSVKGFIQQWEGYENEGFKPNVTIIFASSGMILQEIQAFLKPRNVKVFGSSSCGEFLYDDSNKILSEGGLVCSMLRLDPDSFRTCFFEGAGHTSYGLGKNAGEWAIRAYQDPAVLVVASGLTIDGEQFVQGLRDSLGMQSIIYGGLAGDDAHFRETLVFSESELTSDGALLLVLDRSHYDVDGMATGGWVSIGADKMITSSKGNIVYTIDHQPALDVYKMYLNVNDSDLPEIGVEYPLLIRKSESEEIIRAVLNVDRDQKALIFAGSVPEGSTVTFSTSPGFEIIDLTRKKVAEFYEQNSGTDLLLLFSCMARHNALGPTIIEEIESSWNLWKKTLLGFFTYGEIGNNTGMVCEFHNQTFTLVSIKEK